MRVLILFNILFSFTLPVLGNDGDIASCEKEGSRFGNGAGKDDIPSECIQKFNQKATPYTKRVGKITAIGHKNIIFINDPETKLKGQNVITGKYTELEDVTALALDDKNKEIAVIDNSRDILFHSSVITGNVAPLRVLKLQDIEGAVDLIINPDKNQLIVLNPTLRQVQIYSREANIHAPEGKKKIEVLKRIGKVDGEYLAINSQKQELFVINVQAGVILAWDLESFAARKILFSIPKDEVKSVQFKKEDESIHLLTDKKDLKISVKLETK